MSGRLGVVWFLRTHHPVGERETVLDAACAAHYTPLLDALAAHPTVHVAWHLGGPLSEWLVARRPELVAALRALVARGQVELVGGGLGAPAWNAISQRDRVGQLRAMRRHLEQTYATRVTGAWTGDWAPGSAPPFAALAAAGVNWVAWGAPAARADATPVTFRAVDGVGVRVLGVDPEPGLRLGFPGGVAALLDVVAARGVGGARGVAIDLGGGPVPPGAWPQWVAAVAGAESLESLTAAQALDRWRPRPDPEPAVYVGEPACAARTWLDARSRVVSASCALLGPGDRRAEEARRQLYRSQGELPDDANGLGRPRLRAALASAAMRAERLAREALGAEVPPLDLREADLDVDGRTEVLIQTPELAAVVVPHRGGQLVALDHARSGCDWLAGYRWPTEGHPRGGAVDRVLAAAAGPEQLATGGADESDLSTGVYLARVADSPDEVRVVCVRAGTWRRGDATRPIRVEKELRCPAGSDTLEVRYTVTGGGAGTDAVTFVSEWNLELLAADADDRWLRGPDGTRWGTAGAVVDRAGVDGIDAVDDVRGAAVALRVDQPARIVTWPVTAHERYQATGVGVCVPVALGEDAPVEFTLRVRLTAPEES